MRHPTLIIAFALTGLAGCSAQDRAETHARRANEAARQAREELRDGRNRANDELRQADEKASADCARAADEQRQARADERKTYNERQPVVGHDNDRIGERQPVAGRVDYERGPLLEDSLRDELGGDWVVERRGPSFLATRRKIKLASDDFRKKMNAESMKLRNDHRDAVAHYEHNQVVLRGRINDCKDAAKAADKFAGIDGVNRIFVDISCMQ